MSLDEPCPKCGASMEQTEQEMVLEDKIIRIIITSECVECETTVQYRTEVDREKASWVKKTVYSGESLDFVDQEGGS